MDYLCDDLIYILFAIYRKAPHVLVTNKYINDMFDVNIDNCCLVLLKYRRDMQLMPLIEYFKNYNTIGGKGIRSYNLWYKQLNYKNCSIAVSITGYFLWHIPDKLKDYNICLIAVSNHGWALRSVPNHLKDNNICRIAISKHIWAFNYVPDNLKTYDMCISSVSKSGILLQYVPDKFRDYNMCLAAVSNQSWALFFVPDNLKDVIKKSIKK